MKVQGSSAALTKEQRKVAQKYVQLLEAVRGPITVWAEADEGLLHFHTLISDDDEIEKELYRAELALMHAIDPDLVDFDVYVHPETVYNFLFKDQTPLYQRA